MSHQQQTGGARCRIEQSDRALCVEIVSEDGDLQTVVAATRREFDHRAEEFTGVKHTDVVTLRPDDDGVWR